MDEKDPLPGNENLTMADQMRARAKSSALRTSPVTGAVENPRREYLKNRIQAYAKQAAKSMTGERV